MQSEFHAAKKRTDQKLSTLLGLLLILPHEQSRSLHVLGHEPRVVSQSTIFASSYEERTARPPLHSSYYQHRFSLVLAPYSLSYVVLLKRLFNLKADRQTLHRSEKMAADSASYHVYLRTKLSAQVGLDLESSDKSKVRIQYLWQVECRCNNKWIRA